MKQKAKEILFYILIFLTMFPLAVLAATVNIWLLLLIIPLILILQKIEKRFVLPEAPPMPVINWDKDTENKTTKEIDKDIYCSAGCYENGKCSVAGVCLSICDNRHRKHPTKKQFKEEYGYEWTGAIYCHCMYEDCNDKDCKYKSWGDGEEYDCLSKLLIVCACTPFGKPDDAWRPEQP